MFWDAKSGDIDIKRNAQYIIERVLDFGRDNEVRWLWRTYSKPLLKKVVSRSHSLRPRTKALWKLILRKS